MTDSSVLRCLYYPFSRLLDITTLKYLLLIYDSVTFIDEADTTEWRHMLLNDMRRDSSFFDSIAEMADDYQMLYDSGIVRVVNPNELGSARSDAVAAATLADLADESFVKLASRPSAFGLPARSSRLYRTDLPEVPTWQVFRGKLPTRLLDGSVHDTDSLWARSLVRPGAAGESWTLTYEAGSAATLNYYLEASSELGTTPITTSQLHHQLLLRKIKRTFGTSGDLAGQLGSYERRRYNAVSSGAETVEMLGSLFPATVMETLTFEDILKFRAESEGGRHALRSEIERSLRVISEDPVGPKYDREVGLVLHGLADRFRRVQSDLQEVRDRALPSVPKAALFATAGGGAYSSLASFLGGLSTAGLVAASALTAVGAAAHQASTIWADRRSALRRQGPAIGYLMSIDRLR
jgi:hypothetical protein